MKSVVSKCDGEPDSQKDQFQHVARSSILGCPHGEQHRYRYRHEKLERSSHTQESKHPAGHKVSWAQQELYNQIAANNEAHGQGHAHDQNEVSGFLEMFHGLLLALSERIRNHWEEHLTNDLLETLRSSCGN